MRIIIDHNNYFVAGSLAENIECEYGTCQEYIGEVPDGYSSCEEWLLYCDCKNAYKLVNNDLVYDENRDNELKEKYAKEEEENAIASHKWVREQLGKNSSLVVDEFSYNTSGESLIVIDDSGAYEIPSLQVSSDVIDKCNVLVSNKNLLGIDALTQTINGVTITINPDGTITLNGTAADNIELTLKGTSNNLDMLFLVLKETDYTISGLDDNVSLNLYNYDGIDRTLISSGTNKTSKLR